MNFLSIVLSRVSIIAENPLLRLFKVGAIYSVVPTAVVIATLPASAQQAVPLRIRNACNHPLEVAVMLHRWRECSSDSGVCADHYEGGWWYVEAGETLTPTDNGRIWLTPIPGVDEIDVYARTVDGSDIVWSGRDSVITANDPKLFLPDGSPLPYAATSVSSEGLLNLRCE